MYQGGNKSSTEEVFYGHAIAFVMSLKSKMVFSGSVQNKTSLIRSALVAPVSC